MSLPLANGCHEKNRRNAKSRRIVGKLVVGLPSLTSSFEESALNSRSAILILCLFLSMRPLHGAQVVQQAVSLGDFDIASSETINRSIDFAGSSDVSGFGIVTDWIAVVADNGGGLEPWALDLRVRATAPSGAALVWDPIGGDITIADYPLADYSPTYSSPQVGGQYTLDFSTPGVRNPYVSGLRNTSVYSLSEVADVVIEYDGSVATGPMWNRPFFIEGISGLGPVVYDVLPFSVSVSGGYSFESFLPSGRNNFTFLYRGSFDPDAPLDNLLDYGLGNGSAQNGTPRGTSLIESLLLEGEEYFYVTSQFERFIPGGDFETTIIGPAELAMPGSRGDFNMDGVYNCTDLDLLYAEIMTAMGASEFDLDGDGLVDVGDLSAWLSAAGNVNLGEGNVYLEGDANLDGGVDVADFNLWNANKFTFDGGWCSGDFNADGQIDVGDFNLWNSNKFQSSAAVPEPQALWLALLAIIPMAIHRLH